MELTRCPECAQPAEIEAREVWESTGGPVEHARVRCVGRHVFLLPVAWLAREPRAPSGPSGASVTVSARVTRSHA